jgi:pyrroloquinoline-quinone synthase
LGPCEALGREAFVERLRAEGQARYHDKHPFHLLMHEGKLSPEQLRAWVANRYYYQTRIPIKDALILSKSDDRAFRRMWMHRITDHDGEGEGLDLWLKLADGVGLERDAVMRYEQVLPAVRFACDAYVDFVRQHSLLEAVASSLTEYFAPDLHQRRAAAWEQHYPWVKAETLQYFRNRIPKGKRDADQTLEFVVARARTAELQAACVAALVRKCEILWALLDALQLHYVGRATR